MNLDNLWVKDPKTGEGSVSLTLVVTMTLVCLFGMGLEMSGVIKNTSMAFEMFGASCALYWGRKWNSSKGQSIGE